MPIASRSIEADPLGVILTISVGTSAVERCMGGDCEKGDRDDEERIEMHDGPRLVNRECGQMEELLRRK